MIFLFQFITSDVYGLFCWSFCDFGDSFEVMDPNGEEPKETFIAKITKVNKRTESLRPKYCKWTNFHTQSMFAISMCLTKLQTLISGHVGIGF